MTVRPSVFALGLLACLMVLMLAALAHAALSSGGATRMAKVRDDLVQPLGLIDLALFTEARYTRHPSMADLHSAFQDHPVSLDHFPTGSLIGPPDYFGGPVQQTAIFGLEGQKP